MADEFSEDELFALARAKRVFQTVAERCAQGSHSRNVAIDCAASVDRLIKTVLPNRYFEWQTFAREIEFD